MVLGFVVCLNRVNALSVCLGCLLLLMAEQLSDTSLVRNTASSTIFVRCFTRLSIQGDRIVRLMKEKY